MPTQRSSLIFIAFCLLGSNAQADQQVDERLRVSPTGTVLVHCVRGDVSIVGWDRDEAHVTGTLDDLADGLQFEVDGEQTIIRVKLKREGGVWGDGADLEIFLPRTSRVRLEAVSTDVELEDIVGDIAVRTVSGDVSATNIGSLIHVQTASGDIDLDGGSGEVRAMTTSGDARLELDADRVTVDTVSGEVELELGAFDYVAANAVSGELEIEGELRASGQLEARSTNGDIELRLQEPVHALAELRTGRAGSIDNRLSDAAAERDPAGYALRTEMGDGRGRIRVHTISGEIRLEPR